MNSRDNDADLKSSEHPTGSDAADFTITDAIPIAISILAPDGRALYVNKVALDLIGVTLDEVKRKGHLALTCHPDDLDGVLEKRRIGLSGETLFALEMRLLRYGEYRWNLVEYNPLKDDSGTVIRWYVTAIDIEDRKRTEQALLQSQFYLREANRLASMGSWALSAAGFDYWSPEMFEIYGLDPGTRAPTVDEYLKLIPLEDREFIQQKIRQLLEDRQEFDFTKRIVRPDGEVRYVRCAGSHLIDGSAFQGLVGTAMDVTNQERLMHRLRQNEQDLLRITDSIANPIAVLAPDGAMLYANRVTLDLSEHTSAEVKNEGFIKRICHPEDLDRVLDQRRTGLLEGVPFESEMRLLKHGEYRWQLAQYNPLKDESGKVIRWYVTATDIDDRKRSEEILRQSEANFRTMIDAIRQYVVVLGPDGRVLQANRVAQALTGYTIDQVNDGGFFPRAFHPDDVERVQAERQDKLLLGNPFDLEMRLRLKNGQYRWQLFQYEPLKDDRGGIIRWYCTATDIDDRKKAEDQLRDENVKLDQERVYLEEQIRSELGFEHIVGSSPSLKRVLELVETVAPSDSTVLLLGETGTGKELIARAVHDRSRRKGKMLVKLNCAAIPTGLLESELFGHEKGAFTGAVVQKIGRMELADQSTLFLDEVGDIPIEIQPKLLRALQEREFERLGSTNTRKVNVRLVAATNCNLEKMVAQRQFRSDLFYRLNVFPIRIPPLRERKEDIPLLVAYFVQKFAKQLQKRVNSIPVATMKALTAWDWPGNIRELENFIERAVILTRGESLTAPLTELRKVVEEEPDESAPEGGDEIARIVERTIASLKDKNPVNEYARRQQEEIIRVLTECKGRVGGSDGAAARMGLSRTTLISRMKKLGISPYDYA